MTTNVKKDCLLPIRMKKRFYFVLLTAFFAVVNVSGQYRYCLSYQDFCNNKWEEPDNPKINNELMYHDGVWPNEIKTVSHARLNALSNTIGYRLNL